MPSRLAQQRRAWLAGTTIADLQRCPFAASRFWWFSFFLQHGLGIWTTFARRPAYQSNSASAPLWCMIIGDARRVGYWVTQPTPPKSWWP